MDTRPIIQIDVKLISEGILLKKYISSGKMEMLNTTLKKILNSSMYIEKMIPRTIPKTVAKKPISNPIIKKIFFIERFFTPIDFRMAISLVLFLTNIVKPEIILNAATIIIKDRIINITFLSTLSAENKDLFVSFHENIK